MVRVMITRGTYGWRPVGSRHSVAVSRGEYCEVSQEEALRLQELGVGEIINDPPKYPAEEVATNPAPSFDTDAGDDTPNQIERDTDDVNAYNVDDLMELTKKDLLAMAADLGLDPSKSATKEALANMIAEAEIPDQDAIDASIEGETPPELTVSDPS